MLPDGVDAMAMQWQCNRRPCVCPCRFVRSQKPGEPLRRAPQPDRMSCQTILHDEKHSRGSWLASDTRPFRIHALLCVRRFVRGYQALPSSGNRVVPKVRQHSPGRQREIQPRTDTHTQGGIPPTQPRHGRVLSFVRFHSVTNNVNRINKMEG